MEPPERAVVMQLLSIAAGMLSDVEPAAAVRAAQAAGFPALGFRFSPPGPDDAQVQAIARSVGDAGLQVLDIEFARFTPGDEEQAWHRRLVDIGAALGAAFMIAVSMDTDVDRTRDRYADLVAYARQVGGPRPALEFMRPTAVKTVDAARAVVERVEGGAILVDALHLHRGGTDPHRLRDIDPSLMPYVQLCDAPPSAPTEVDEELIHEARRGRLLPGDGALPLDALLDATPADAPLSVEVLSSDLMARYEPHERARLTMAATTRLLEGRGTA
jgi:sugar phosphate isomerase/epimerase